MSVSRPGEQRHQRAPVQRAAATRSSPRRPRIVTALGSLFLAGAGALVGVALVEIGLRVFAPTTNDYQIWPPYTRVTFHIDPSVHRGVAGPNLFLANSRGLRADELTPEHSYRILTLGGSTTECLILDQREAWPRLVQDHLSDAWGGRAVWVGNAGASGNNTREHVFQVPLLLKEYPETDLVVLLLGVNDLGLRLQQDTDYDPFFLERENVEDEMIPRAFALYPREFREALPWVKRLEIYGRLRLARNFLVMKLLQRGARQDPTGDNIVRWRENRRNAVGLRPRLPDLEEALDEYRRNIRRIVNAARSGGAEVLLMTQPSIWRPDLTPAERDTLWWGGVGWGFMEEGARSEYYTVEALATGMKVYNDVLLETCATLDAHCFDLAAEVPKDSAAFYDGVHFNEAGSARIARLVADYILEIAP